MHYGRYMDLHTPPVTPAAFLGLAVRLDFDRQMPSSYLSCLLSLPPNREAADALRFAGPTLEDLIEARLAYVRPWTGSSPFHAIDLNNLAFEMTSTQHDAAWRRLTLMKNGRLSEIALSNGGSAFVPGQLNGLWTGKLLVSSNRCYLQPVSCCCSCHASSRHMLSDVFGITGPMSRHERPTATSRSRPSARVCNTCTQNLDFINLSKPLPSKGMLRCFHDLDADLVLHRFQTFLPIIHFFQIPNRGKKMCQCSRGHYKCDCASTIVQ